MLLLLFVGMAALFTFFRVRYPNLGGVDGKHPAMQTPALRVACEAEHLPAVGKVARAYELEFGVQVMLSSISDAIVPKKGYHLVIRRSQPKPTQNRSLDGNQFLVTPPSADDEKEVRTILRATVFATADAQKQGASRFARYLLARDKGLPLLVSNKSAIANADPWIEEPQPSVLVWEAAFPFLQPELKRFEENEGVRLLLTTGDCAFLSRKANANKTVDAVISFGADCDLGVVVPHWRPMQIPSRQIVLATSRQSVPFLDKSDSQPASLRLGGVRGIHELILKQTPQPAWPQRFRQLLAAQSPAEYAKPQSLLRAIAQRKIDVGIILEQPNQQTNSQIRLETLPNAAARLPILFWISQNSNYRQLLSRLGASMSRQQPAADN